MSNVRNTAYPMNLLNKIACGKWTFKIPEDIDDTLINVLSHSGLSNLERALIEYRFQKRYTCKQIGKIFNMDTKEVVGKIEKIIRRIRTANMERIVVGDKTYKEIKKEMRKPFQTESAFNLTVPFRTCVEARLKSNNIHSIEELISLSYDELIKIPRIGPRTANEIRDKLALSGYGLKQSKNPSLFHEYCKRLWENT